MWAVLHFANLHPLPSIRQKKSSKNHKIVSLHYPFWGAGKSKTRCLEFAGRTNREKKGSFGREVWKKTCGCPFVLGFVDLLRWITHIESLVCDLIWGACCYGDGLHVNRFSQLMYVVPSFCLHHLARLLRVVIIGALVLFIGLCVQLFHSKK